jgi:hypothetical protein
LFGSLVAPAQLLRTDEALGVFKWLTELELSRMESDQQRNVSFAVTFDASGVLASKSGPNWHPDVVVPDRYFTEGQCRLGKQEFPLAGKISDALGFRDVLCSLVLRQTREVAGSHIYDFDGMRFLCQLDAGLTVDQSQLSFGQKRLLAFYWYLACIPEGIVIADELVNGFHHDWIKGCLEEIGDRQAILATQSPLLLDYLEFEDAEQVRKSLSCAASTTAPKAGASSNCAIRLRRRGPGSWPLMTTVISM